MFKKKPHIKPAAPLRSSERRRLADDIIREYGLEPVSVPALTGDGETSAEEKDTARIRLRNALLPEDTQQARFSTTLGPEGKEVGGTVYIGTSVTPAPTSQGNVGEMAQQHQRILWWSYHGHLYPTIYTLWSFPRLIPLLHTPAVVVAKMQGGADLMTPGLARGPPFPQGAGMGSLVGVAALERPSVPVVVGVCVKDIAGLGSVVGEKGRAVEGLHWVGDECWGWGMGGGGSGEVPERLGGWLEEEKEEEERDREVVVEGKLGSAEPVEAEPKNDDNATADPPKELAQPDLDAAFRNAFLYGLHHHLTIQPTHPTHGLVFPLSPSFIMSNLIQPFLPAALPQQQLQMKKTSWKTLRKFVKGLEKEGVVRGKDQGGSETVVVEVFWGAEALVGFRPYGGVKGVGGVKGEKGSMMTTEGGGGGAGAGDESLGQTLQVVNFYKPTSKLAAIFSGPGVVVGEDEGKSGTKKPPQMFLTPPEVREIVTRYLESENLISPSNKRVVALNPVLGNAVFDGTGHLDHEILAKGTVPRDALFDRILAAMSPYHAVLRNPTPSPPATAAAADIKPKPGQAPKVRITLETRAGNKTVTKVSGLEAYHVGPRRLAEELKKVCAGSAGVEPLAGANKKGEAPVMEVMVQGPQREAVVRALERRGVLGKWVEVLDRTKKGKGRG